MSTRYDKRNTLILDPPANDSKEAREKVEKHNRQFGKRVIWSDSKEATEIESKPVEPPVTEPEGEVDEPTIEPEESETEINDKIPEDRICPYCGTKAKTDASYMKNHGENCWKKPD